jgi:hypothetical protein
MRTSNPTPGPDADAAFTFGLATAVILAVLAIALAIQSGSMTLLNGVVLALVVLPAVFVVTSCVLAVWLGYDPDVVDAYELTQSLRERAEK